MSTTEASAVTAQLKATLRVLIVDDEASLRESCASVLGVEGYNVAVCGRGTEAMDMVRRQRFDIVLLDVNLGQVSGLDLLAACLEAFPDTIAIIMTGNPSVASSISALQAGAWDYLPKPFSATHLQILMGRAAHAAMEARDSGASDGASQNGAGETALLGNSSTFRAVVALARKVAGTDASVFLSGESGTGKEQIAQFIHAHSRRSSRELVAVNCAALPENLLETEMFGHVQGAFTGAVKDKPGLLEAANGGTFFLDEITEMPGALQAKLLRVIQDGVVRRLGSTSTDAVVNVRFIAATNRDIREARAEEVLRSDLFYRLCVVPIHIPPLRDRGDDIVLLARHFLNVYWSRHRAPRDAPPVLGDAALAALRQRPWPGNVRELQNVIEHAVVLLDPGSEVRPDDLPHLSVPGATPPSASNSVTQLEPVGDESYHGARERILSRFESRYLRWLVGRAGGNMSRAARIAGVDRTTLYRLMDKHGLQRDTIISAG